MRRTRHRGARCLPSRRSVRLREMRGGARGHAGTSLIYDVDRGVGVCGGGRAHCSSLLARSDATPYRRRRLGTLLSPTHGRIVDITQTGRNRPLATVDALSGPAGRAESGSSRKGGRDEVGDRRTLPGGQIEAGSGRAARAAEQRVGALGDVGERLRVVLCERGEQPSDEARPWQALLVPERDLSGDERGRGARASHVGEAPLEATTEARMDDELLPELSCEPMPATVSTP